MQLGFHGATTLTSDLVTDLRISAAAGFRYLEIWAEKVDTFLKEHSLADLQVLLTDHQIKPIALDALVFFAFRGSEYPQVKARCLELCKIASAIHCPAIVVVASPLPNREMGWESVVAEYVSVLRELADLAQPFGIKLAFEFLGFGWTSVRTPRGAYEIIQKVDRANVGMSFDTAHFYGGGGLLSELDEVNPSKIFAFHINDMDDVPKEAFSDSLRNLPGHGVIPLDAICHKLKDIGYSGHCSVELFRPEFWQQDPMDVARRTRTAALQVLSPYFPLE